VNKASICAHYVTSSLYRLGFHQTVIFQWDQVLWYLFSGLHLEHPPFPCCASSGRLRRVLHLLKHRKLSSFTFTSPSSTSNVINPIFHQMDPPALRFHTIALSRDIGADQNTSFGFSTIQKAKISKKNRKFPRQRILNRIRRDFCCRWIT
jgi:hypothetical protein